MRAQRPAYKRRFMIGLEPVVEWTRRFDMSTPVSNNSRRAIQQPKFLYKFMKR